MGVRSLWYDAAGALRVDGWTTVDALAIAPLDLVYLSDPARAGELQARLVAAATPPSDARPDWRMELHPGRSPAWPAERLGMEEMLHAAGEVRRLLLSARPLDAADLGASGEPAPTPVDGGELAPRVTEAAAFVNEALQALAAGGATAVAALRTAADFGVADVVSVDDEPLDTGSLDAAVRRVAGALAERHAALAALENGFDRAAAAPDALLAHDAARLQALFGADFRVLPPFSVPDPAALEVALNDPGLCGGDGAAAGAWEEGSDPLAAETWLQRASRVRTGARRLHAARLAAEALRGEAPPLAVAQLPHVPGEPWVGRESADPAALGSRTSIVLSAAGAPLAPSSPVAGLMVDEWVEVVPSTHETTGVTFHFDAPGNRAPNAVLLAVPPDPSQADWSPAAIRSILDETLDLMMTRTVDPDALWSGLRGLPATYFANNVDGDTLATDFVHAAGG
ncbi:MAG TPA: hypothetical protein VM759_09040 [Longimicrobium sp.]|nr:hypothetical protein [Longimicrobium sp.]